jgi:hypothetical protein
MRPTIQLQRSRALRDIEEFPSADSELGAAFWKKLVDSLGRGRPKPAFLLVLPDAIESVPAAQVTAHGPLASLRISAALAGEPGAEALGLAGAVSVKTRRDGEPAPALLVFFERPDNRWWLAWSPLDEGGQVRWASPEVRAAVDGWPRPRGLGGWFSLSRREGLRLERAPEPSTQVGLGLIH